jgi:ubiquinone/menaquinone biosynthesis C-methylase UbiE
MTESSSSTSTSTSSSIMMSDMDGLWYDFGIAVSTWGREKSYRDEILQLVNLHPGMHVLDVACGTGSMALLASEYVLVSAGDSTTNSSPRSSISGRVVGIDASTKLLERANHKLAQQMKKKKKTDPKTITFQHGLAENLPFPDGIFDVAMMIISLHHFPTEELQKAVIVEMKRVLKPGGKIVLVDFPNGKFPKSSHSNSSTSGTTTKSTKKCKHHTPDDHNNHHSHNHSHSHSHSHSHHHNHHFHGLPNLSCLSACSTTHSKHDDDDDDNDGNGDLVVVENDPLYKKTAEAGFFFVEGWKVKFLNTIAVTGRK